MEKRSPALDPELDEMSFGKYTGELPKNIPNDYFQWLYNKMVAGGYEKKNTNITPEDEERLRTSNRKWLVDRFKTFNYLFNLYNNL